MTMNPSDKTAPWANWTTTSRTPGILYVVAGLIVLSSSVAGAAAPAAVQADPTASAGLLDDAGVADEVDLQRDAQAADAAPADDPADAAAGTEADTGFATPFKSGDRLSPEQVAAYKAYLASAREAGTHQGPGVVSAWA